MSHNWYDTHGIYHTCLGDTECQIRRFITLALGLYFQTTVHLGSYILSKIFITNQIYQIRFQISYMY